MPKNCSYHEKYPCFRTTCDYIRFMDCLMAGILEYQCKIEELEHRRISRESTLKSRYLYWRRKYNELKVTVKKLKGYKGYMKREAQNETRDTQKDS